MKKKFLKKHLIATLGLTGVLIGSVSGCAKVASTDSVDVTESESTDVTKSDVALSENEDSNLVYGTVNVSYADFYYGELNNIEAKTDATTGQYDVENLAVAAGYEEEGMYDAVTSATTSKSTKFESTYLLNNFLQLFSLIPFQRRRRKVQVAFYIFE